MLPIDEVVAVDGEPVTQSTEAVGEGLSEGMDEPVALLEPADEAGQTSESLVLENEAGGDLVVADIAEES